MKKSPLVISLFSLSRPKRESIIFFAFGLAIVSDSLVLYERRFCVIDCGGAEERRQSTVKALLATSLGYNINEAGALSQ